MSRLTVTVNEVLHNSPAELLRYHAMLVCSDVILELLYCTALHCTLSTAQKHATLVPEIFILRNAALLLYSAALVISSLLFDTFLTALLPLLLSLPFFCTIFSFLSLSLSLSLSPSLSLSLSRVRSAEEGSQRASTL
jgi:hypothetical protein